MHVLYYVQVCSLGFKRPNNFAVLLTVSILNSRISAFSATHYICFQLQGLTSAVALDDGFHISGTLITSVVALDNGFHILIASPQLFFELLFAVQIIPVQV